MKFSSGSGITLVVVFLLYLLPQIIHAQTQMPAKVTMNMSLLQAQDYAYENNYTLINSKYDVEIAHKMVKQNTAIGLPQINATIDYLDYIEQPTSLIPGEFFGQPGQMIPLQFGTKYNATLKANATQLIYSGQYLVGLQTAKAYLETAKEKNIKDRIDIRDRVADTYILLLINDEAIMILDSLYKIVTRQAEEVRISFQNGMIEDVDVDQAELNKSDLEARLTDAQNSKNIVYANLKFLIGLKDNQELTLTDDLGFFLAQVDKEALINQPFDYNKNIDYLYMKKGQYLVFMQYKLAKTAYQPTLLTSLGFSENAQRNEWNFFQSNQSWFRMVNWGVSLSIPIWSSGSRKYSVDQARLNYAKSKVTEEQTRVGLQLTVETSKKDFNNAYFVYQNKKQGFAIAVKIFQKTSIKYKEGVASSTDLNQRYNQLLMANSDYMQSMYNVLRMKIQLTKLLEKF